MYQEILEILDTQGFLIVGDPGRSWTPKDFSLEEILDTQGFLTRRS
jgi:hypothetical protein